MKTLTTSQHHWLYLLVTSLLISGSAVSQTLLDPASQKKFVNPLPIPAVIDATARPTTLEMEMTQFTQDLGLQDPVTGTALLTTVWGYGQVGSKGSYPGPTLLTRKDVPLDVYWYNNLVAKGTKGKSQPLAHLLPVDPSLHWALHDVPNWEQAGVPLVTHLHGGHTESASDGLPEAWYTPNFALKGKHFVKGDKRKPYHYDNDQEAATIWYHDHALGITRLNVYAGLAGFYLITDDWEQQLRSTNQLPAAPYDLGLAIQDRMFTADGQLYYPAMPASGTTPSHMPEFFGNFILVNGKAWPVLDVEPRQYRFRLLNGSDSRFYDLFLTSSSGASLPFWQIGSDGGFLPAPVLHDKLLISPGERKDVVVDFSDPALIGQTIIIRNNARAPYPFGGTINPQHEGQIMAIRVSKPLNAAYPSISLPASLRPAPLLPPPSTTTTRQLILFEGTDEYGRLVAKLGTVKDGALAWDAPITENPKLHDSETWEIYNLTPDAHPIHLHLVFFQVLNTQKFKATYDMHTGKVSAISLLGNPQAPAVADAGKKDTYPIMPGEMARLVATFDRPGRYVWHCHILSHEDHEMMRPYHVGPLPAEMLATHRTLAGAEEAAEAYRLYPNPAQQVLSLQLTAPEAGTLQLRIYDLQGRLAGEQQHEIPSAGEHRIAIDAAGLSSGLYTCIIQFGDRTHQEKLLITK